VHFSKKLTFFQFSTFVNENIDIVLNSGIDIVAYFNFFVVWMPSVSCCSRRLACSGRVICRQNRYSPWRGSWLWSFSRGGRVLHPAGWLDKPLNEQEGWGMNRLWKWHLWLYFNPLTPTVATWVQLPAPDRVKPSFVSFNIRALWRSVTWDTAIKHPVSDPVKSSFVIFDIRALWRSGLSVRMPGCQKLQMTA